MNITGHLTENQLTEYFGNAALEGETKHAIGRHLLLCDFCLKRLPQPTPEQFLTALMTENEAEEESGAQKTDFAARLELLVQTLTQPKVFAWSAGVLAIVLVFTATIWFNAAKSADTERELAQNLETKDTQFISSQVDGSTIDLPKSFPPVERNDDRSSNASNRIASNQDSLDAKDIEPKQNSKTAPRNVLSAKTPARLPSGEKANISSTRGGSSPQCGDQKSISLSSEMSDETVVLKWRKIPNAAKYHLYVSDDEEILLDEFETAEGTSYVLKKTLDPQKTYKWKVVVTLENGNTIIGDSQKFTVKDLKFNQRKSEKKEKSVVRCSEDK